MTCIHDRDLELCHLCMCEPFEAEGIDLDHDHGHDHGRDLDGRGHRICRGLYPVYDGLHRDLCGVGVDRCSHRHISVSEGHQICNLDLHDHRTYLADVEVVHHRRHRCNEVVDVEVDHLCAYEAVHHRRHRTWEACPYPFLCVEEARRPYLGRPLVWL